LVSKDLHFVTGVLALASFSSAGCRQVTSKKRGSILARPGNTYEKLKRDSNKKLKAKEKRESKRVRKATKLSGGPAKPADESEPAELGRDSSV
jgi:hypothetical protein